jgi:hypothetical protein
MDELESTKEKKEAFDGLRTGRLGKHFSIIS